MESIQVVDKDGHLEEVKLEDLLRTSGVAEAGLDYGIVAIMGPQSSGKSTLLNHVFGTTFREMNATIGRSQTTQGIWLEVSPKLKDKTLVLDLEGTDGRERGEDDTTFERQSALFALAVSDVLLINLWHHDVGREQGSGKPLLKTVLQEKLKLFNSGKKKTLVFVIRDRSSKTPLEMLSKTLNEDLNKIWDSIAKPEEYNDKKLEDVFSLNFTSLPNYEEKEEEFEAEAVLLRSRFKRSSDECYLPSETSVPGSALSMSVDRIWKIIQEDKNLDLPAHRVMVATVRCDQSIWDLGEEFAKDTKVLELQEAAAIGLTADFGEMCKKIIEGYLVRFDELVEFFDRNVCQSKREELMHKLQSIMSIALSAQFEYCRTNAMSYFSDQMSHVSTDDFASETNKLRMSTLEMFDESIHQACIVSDETPREARDVRARLADEMENIHLSTVKELKGVALNSSKKMLTKALHGPVSALFEDLEDDLWTAARKLKSNLLDEHNKKLEKALKGLDLSAEELDSCKGSLSSHIKESYDSLIEDAINSASTKIKNKFVKAFCYSSKGLPRVWDPKIDIAAINLESRREAAKALSLLVYNQLEKEADIAEVSQALQSCLAGGGTNEDQVVFTSSSWPAEIEIDEEHVLLSPIQCRSIWREMDNEISYTVQQAILAQEAAKQASNRAPPLWAIASIIILGWNELMMLLWNPFLLVLLVLFLILGRAIYMRVDIASELEKGFVPALISISMKLVPIIIEVSLHFAQQVKTALAPPQAEPVSAKEKES